MLSHFAMPPYLAAPLPGSTASTVPTGLPSSTIHITTSKSAIYASRLSPNQPRKSPILLTGNVKSTATKCRGAPGRSYRPRGAIVAVGAASMSASVGAVEAPVFCQIAINVFVEKPRLPVVWAVWGTAVA